jgi:hypothetical protein
MPYRLSNFFIAYKTTAALKEWKNYNGCFLDLQKNCLMDSMGLSFSRPPIVQIEGKSYLL